MAQVNRTIPEGILSAGGVLDRIVAARAKRVEDAKRDLPLPTLKNDLPAVQPPPSMAAALADQNRINIIAEIKRRSPSKGIIRADFDPVRIAVGYAEGGAAAVSVLTEEDFFDGSLDHLRAVRAALPHLPLLRKDFVFDDYQVYEAAAAGASAVLLITAILGDELFEHLIGLSRDAGLDALVEVHSEQEMRRAKMAGAGLIGVNNRDLTTFSVDLQTSIRLAPLAPPGAVLVSESGISSVDDIKQLRAAGYNAFLVGEHFMRASEPGDELRRLVEMPKEA